MAEGTPARPSINRQLLPSKSEITLDRNYAKVTSNKFAATTVPLSCFGLTSAK